MTAYPFAQKSESIQELIDSGKLFTPSDLLNSEKAKSDTDKAEGGNNAGKTKMV